MKQLVVTAAIIEERNKYLLTQRLDGKHKGGCWEFPGGKVEEERLREGLEREIREELGIEIEAREVFEATSHQYKDRQVILIAFNCNYVSGEIERKEVADYEWVEPRMIDRYDMIEADLPFVEKLK